MFDRGKSKRRLYDDRRRDAANLITNYAFKIQHDLKININVTNEDNGKDKEGNDKLILEFSKTGEDLEAEKDDQFTGRAKS